MVSDPTLITKEGSFMDFTNPKEFKNINSRCSCFNLRKVTRAMTQLYDRALEPIGIRATQYTLLISMAGHSAHTLTEMAHSLLMDRTTLTRNLRPLEKMGLIESSDARDKRSKAYMLTEKGKEMIRQAIPVWEKVQVKVETALGLERYARLLQELDVTAKVIGSF